jgi:hypothetical protein
LETFGLGLENFKFKEILNKNKNKNHKIEILIFGIGPKILGFEQMGTQVYIFENSAFIRTIDPLKKNSKNIICYATF